jgi:hypothetical protein
MKRGKEKKKERLENNVPEIVLFTIVSTVDCCSWWS